MLERDALFPRVLLQVYELSPCTRAELDWNVGRQISCNYLKNNTFRRFSV